MRKPILPMPANVLAWPVLIVVSATAAVYCWQLPSRQISLRLSAASNDQLRITWDRTSAPALRARSAVLEIRDGDSVHRLPLSSGQVRDGSVTYRRESGDVRVRFTVETADRWAGLRDVSEAVQFRGAAPVPLRVKPAALVAAALPPPAPKPVDRVPDVAPQGEANRREPPRRAAVIPASLPAAFSGNLSLPVPAAPALAIAKPLAAPFPIEAPAGVAPPPPRAAYTGPRSGRLIWTGSMVRRGVVEIEGSHASVGSVEGGLPGVPVTIRVWPAEFTSQGLLVHTSEAAVNNRRELASAANGWNTTFFHWEPDRARELVVLEAPNPTNEYKRLVVRNDARICSVMLVEWSVRPQ